MSSVSLGSVGRAGTPPPSGVGSGLKVAVRCRPFNRREKQLQSNRIISMDGQATVLHYPRAEEEIPDRNFSFDYSFWSHDAEDANFTDQAALYNCVGHCVLEDAFSGYHSCVFAYGQTGSGKSYTMMGAGGGGSDNPERGLTPRLCEDLFQQISAKVVAEAEAGWTAKVEVSYMEIYLEMVRDLLSSNPDRKLKVREHKSTGPYVEDLSSHAVTSYKEVKALMDDGDKLRTVKATSMNDVSSRSHAIFQIIFTQVKTTKRGKQSVTTERVSKISLVDLAGSERSGQINTGTTSGSAKMMKEGNLINKSLSTLGKVMTSLVERQASKNKAMHHVPYRESVLTWLLRDSLGGNSKTFMMAAISPAAANYEETLSTLRYANQAKKIVNSAVVNEDPTAKMIRMLREEITALRSQLNAMSSAPALLGPGRSISEGADLQPVDGRAPMVHSTSVGSGAATATSAAAAHPAGNAQSESVLSKLEMTEKLMLSLATPWEEKLSKTKAMQRERLEVLENHGLLLADRGNGKSVPVGVMVPKCTPYLVNLTHDPFSQHCLVYYLHEGLTRIVAKQPGRDKSLDPSRDGDSDGDSESDAQSIVLEDPAIRPQHCSFRMAGSSGGANHITLLRDDPDADVLVNASRLGAEEVLQSGDQVTVGGLTFLFQTAAAPSASRRGRISNGAQDASGGSRESRGMMGMSAFQKATAAAIAETDGGDGGDGVVPTDPKSPPPGSLAEQVFGAAALAMTGVAPSSELTGGSDGPDGSSSYEAEAETEDSFPDELDDVFNNVDGQMTLLAPPGRSRASANYNFDPEHERAYLAHLVVNMASNQFMFKLMPAYGLFMMFHGQIAQNETSLMQLQCRVAALLEMATNASQKEHNLSKLVLLIANTSELLAAMRSDETLVSTSGNAQVTITSCVVTAFQAILADTKARISLALPAVLYEDAAFADTWASQIQSKRGAQVQTMDDLLNTLTELYDLLTQCLLGPSMVKEMFDSVFYFIGAAVFNIFIESKDKQMYRWDRGLLIRFNLANLVEWAEQRDLGVQLHLERIMQAAQLLQVNKSSLAHLDAVCDSCASLNSLQINKVLTKYVPAEGDSKLSKEIVDCIKARAMTKADVADADDETVSGRVQLTRSEDHLLPFRLKGPFHVDEGLCDEVLLEDARTYLSLIDLASTSCKLPTVLAKKKRKGQGTRGTVPSPTENGSFFSKWFQAAPAKLDTRSHSTS